MVLGLGCMIVAAFVGRQHRLAKEGTTGKRAVKNRNRMLPVDDPDSYERGDYDESGGAEATTPSGEREDMD